MALLPWKVATDWLKVVLKLSWQTAERGRGISRQYSASQTELLLLKGKPLTIFTSLGSEHCQWFAFQRLLGNKGILRRIFELAFISRRRLPVLLLSMLENETETVTVIID